jgi:hypothetical protein
LNLLQKKQKNFTMNSSAASAINQEIVYTDRRTNFDDKYCKFISSNESLITSHNIIDSLNPLFSNFIKKYEVTNEQLSVLRKTFSYLQSHVASNPSLCSSIKLDIATDEELVIYRVSNNGIYNIIIDTDGDLMISFASYKDKGWRFFYDKDKFNPSIHIDNFFSI